MRRILKLNDKHNNSSSNMRDTVHVSVIYAPTYSPSRNLQMLPKALSMEQGNGFRDG